MSRSKSLFPGRVEQRWRQQRRQRRLRPASVPLHPEQPGRAYGVQRGSAGGRAGQEVAESCSQPGHERRRWVDSRDGFGGFKVLVLMGESEDKLGFGGELLIFDIFGTDKAKGVDPNSRKPRHCMVSCQKRLRSLS